MLSLVSLVCLLSFAGTSTADQSPFKPLTYGLNFKAYFRVQAFANEQPIYSGDVYESYHSQLGTCLIKQTSRGTKSARSTFKQFQYDSRAGRLVEFTEQQRSQEKSSGDVDGAEPLLDTDFYLYENGGSNSYRADKLQHELRKDSVRLVPEGANIDSLLLLAHDQEDLTVPGLDLDQFMTPDCLEVLRRVRLQYISGLTRLLHLIECRRGEFKLQQASGSGHAELTRGQTRQVYRAKKLEATPPNSADSKAIGSLDLLVTVHTTTSSSPSGTLESGAIPLSIKLSFEPSISVLINLYQFESVGPDEHLSESASGHSIYLMPLAQPNLSHLLASVQYYSEQKHEGQKQPIMNRPARSFSFEASLTGSHLSQFYRDPIELVVAYDAQLGALAIRSTFTDRSQSDGLTGWARPIVRHLHDSSSGLKLHLMESNFGYVSHGDEDAGRQVGEDEDIAKQPKWRACATDKLTSSEITQLQEGSDGHLLDLAGATYMGEAIVRGIRCQVYERRLFELPSLLGVSENDYVHLGTHLARSKIYLNLYAYGDDLASPNFARLDVRIVSYLDQTQQRSLTLDLSAFDWSASGVQSRDLFTGENLLTLAAQECLLMVPGARHLDMELWFGLGDDEQQGGKQAQSQFRANERLLEQLARDREARDESVREMLAMSALDISPIQQVDLVTEMQLPDNHNYGQASLVAMNFDNNQFLYAKLSFYELWSDSVKEDFIGYAKSLTMNPKFPLTAGLVAGARSYSYNECKWRALHSLLPDRKRSEFNRKDDYAIDLGDLRLFMFCPARLVCLLGDATWTPMRRQKPLKLDNLLEYPYPLAPAADDDKSASEQMGNDEDPTRCVVASVLIKQQVGSFKSKAAGFATAGRPQLDWWLINGASGLGRSIDSHALQKVRELRLELKVKGSSVRAAHATTTTTSANEPNTLGVKVNKLKLSNRVFASSSNGFIGGGHKSTSCSNGGGGGEGWNDVSLLIKPLAGLAYLPALSGAAGEPDKRSVPGAVISSQPLVVASLAECSRACLHSHECRSFSACHEQQRENGARHSVSCVLSRLSWSNELEFHELVRLAGSNTAGQASGAGSPLTLEVTSPAFRDDDEATGDNAAEDHQVSMVQVHLRRSQLCSIRSRAQMDLYRMAQSHLDYVPGPKYLIPARSPDHCARLCQERAQLMRELSKAKNGASKPVQVLAASGLGSSFRTSACHEFRFASEGSYCQLLPLQNHWAVLGLEHLLLTKSEKSASNWQQPTPPSWLANAREKYASLPTLNRWLRWFNGDGQHAEWLAQLRVQSLSEADHYELDFEEIFLAQRNRRLVLRASAEVPQDTEDDFTGSQPQVRLTQYSLYACAKRCLQLRGCRSFDVELPSPEAQTRLAANKILLASGGGGQQRANVCQLNVISAADLRANPSAWPSFALEQSAPGSSSSSSSSSSSAAGEWWHYEPSELALFMISDPSEPRLSLNYESSTSR